MDSFAKKLKYAEDTTFNEIVVVDKDDNVITVRDGRCECSKYFEKGACPHILLLVNAKLVRPTSWQLLMCKDQAQEDFELLIKKPKAKSIFPTYGQREIALSSKSSPRIPSNSASPKKVFVLPRKTVCLPRVSEQDSQGGICSSEIAGWDKEHQLNVLAYLFASTLYFFSNSLVFPFNFIYP
ncbi:hypothetical protein Ciccas_001300 [Cichlidogyrus casuarinus]|uniref:SWIM-type domain-containing protein n=1 Tax=Cichlidogyrus casuarinus TaxID=1844966 RepID=A0ABD2QMQ6_9PLAT